MREGAYDYLSKPLRMQEIRRVVSKALEQHSLIVENKSLLTNNKIDFLTIIIV